MKGAVFNIFEEFITSNWGEETYEEILDAADLETKEPFVGPGDYPDADLFALAGAATERLQVPLPDALRAFGKFAFPQLAAALPGCMDGVAGAKGFLKSVEDYIHVEVKKLHPDALTPTFTYDDPGDDRLTIHYSSQRRLCFFMEGLIDGVAEAFSAKIERTQSSCMHDGAESCRFDLRFA